MKNVFLLSWMLIVTSLSVAQVAQAKDGICVCHRDCSGNLAANPICVDDNAVANDGSKNHGLHICHNDKPNVVDVIFGDCDKREDCGTTCGGTTTLLCPDGVTPHEAGDLSVCPVCPNTTPPVFVGPNGACPGTTNEDPCDGNGDCHLTMPTKSFDFNVVMGGVAANSYVCEVGFATPCLECSQFYFQTYKNKTEEGNVTQSELSEKIYDNVQFFTEATAPDGANLYINDLFMGAQFYVKYCVGVKRLVVGTDPGLVYLATVNPSYSITTGNYAGPWTMPEGGLNDYVDVAKLGAKVYEDCENGLKEGIQGNLDQTLAFGSLEVTDAVITPGTLELCGTLGCEKKQCVYTLLFNETATCYRPVKCVDGDCEPYASTINTQFNATVDLECTDGACGQ